MTVRAPSSAPFRRSQYVHVAPCTRIFCLKNKCWYLHNLVEMLLVDCMKASLNLISVRAKFYLIVRGVAATSTSTSASAEHRIASPRLCFGKCWIFHFIYFSNIVFEDNTKIIDILTYQLDYEKTIKYYITDYLYKKNSLLLYFKDKFLKTNRFLFNHILLGLKLLPFSVKPFFAKRKFSLNYS